MAMDEQWSSPERATLIRLADDLGRAAGIKVTAERLTQPHRTASARLITEEWSAA
jgi:hypothetical protein